MHTRVEIAAKAFKKLIEEYRVADRFSFSEKMITLNPSPVNDSLLKISLVFFVLLPAVICIIQFIAGDTGFITFVLLILTIVAACQIAYKTGGKKIVSIDFGKKQFVFQSAYQTVARFRGSRQLNFSKVQLIKLERRVVRHRNWSKHTWLQLSFFDINGLEFAYINFEDNFPDDKLASRLKVFLEIIVWEYKKTAG